MTKHALLVFLAACGGSGDDGTKANPRVHNVTVDGIEREYLVHVPGSLNDSSDVPAVLMLHGTSGDGQTLWEVSGWKEKAEAEGFIAVFPSALGYCLGEDDNRDGTIGMGEYHVTTKWASGQLGTSTMPLCSADIVAALPADKRAQIDDAMRVHDDMAFFDRIAADLVADYPLDAKRIYVTGFSNGAQMSGRLMIERTNTFAAFAMNAGAPTVPGPALRPVSAVWAVGSKDDRFLEATGATEFTTDASFLATPGIDSLVANLCGVLSLDATAYAASVVDANGRTASRIVFAKSTASANNELVVSVIDEAHHVYPNGTNHPAVMADALWTFFSRHALP